MKRSAKRALAIIAIAVFAVTGCKKGSNGNFDRSNGAGGPFTGADSVITGNISVSRTLTPGKVYKLNGIIFVTGGAKLTIKPGTLLTTGTLVGYRASPTSSIQSVAGVLVVTKGSSIDAVGTASRPITFTSPKAAGSRQAGDFGGIIVLGKSPINQAPRAFEGLPLYNSDGDPLGVDINYGGTESADNSGRIQYVRIDYPGFLLTPDVGISGLTLAGVGSGTTIDHIEVTYSRLDGFSFFGGTVNASYLISLANADDDFDFTYGYKGTIQYAICLKDPSSIHSLNSSGGPDSNGIESDTEGNDQNTNPDRTHPVCSNFTLLGYAASPINGSPLRLAAGARWRRNTDLSMTNSIIAGYSTGVEFFTGTATSATSGGFTGNAVHAYNIVFSPANSISLSGSTNTTSTEANPSLFVGIGLGSLSPFYSTVNSSSFTFNNLRPKVATTTLGAITSASLPQWNSGWVSFVPQTRVDSGL
ncbi:hypothetical protein SAMN05443550_101139 [Pedobacter hartonius]|uniref:T9SS C-terminal target domain-containing protein n=2 Tax=Pedobacter hartonius TaxID=425514 RepID=A0A1H3W8U6_9SPHI|nr:hypothetical protein SAMN05443550_101139 [Pedobacter hartonius]